MGGLIFLGFLSIIILLVLGPWLWLGTAPMAMPAREPDPEPPVIWPGIKIHSGSFVSRVAPGGWISVPMHMSEELVYINELESRRAARLVDIISEYRDGEKK